MEALLLIALPCLIVTSASPRVSYHAARRPVPSASNQVTDAVTPDDVVAQMADVPAAGSRHRPELRRCAIHACESETALVSPSRRDLLRGAVFVLWACAVPPSVQRVLDFPPASFKSIAKEIYADAQSAAGSAPRILELGTGLKIDSIFDDRFRPGSHVVSTDLVLPDEARLAAAEERAARSGYSWEFKRDDATALSFADNSFDVVVCSLTLCSVASVESAVSEVLRVLKPGGTFGFVEHVAVTDQDGAGLAPLVRRLSQSALDPLQQALAHGCHLRRDTPRIIVETFGGASCIAQLRRIVNDDMWPVSQQSAGVVVKPP